MAQILCNLCPITLICFKDPPDAAGDGLDDCENTVDADIVSNE